MIDKILKLLRDNARVKQTCVFFAAFAVTLAVMGGTFGFEHSGMLSGVVTVHAAEDEASAGVGASEEDADAKETAKVKKTKKKTETDANESESAESPDESEKDSADKPAKKTAKTKKKAKTAEDFAAKPGGFVYSESIPMNRELQEYTYQKCVERGLEYELVLAIIWRESRFNAGAVNINSNGTQDSGIMQINDVNKEWLYKHHGIEDLMDPFQNINAGTAMLGNLTAKYGSHKAMMAYQYGEGGMAGKLRRGHTTSSAIEKAYAQRDHYRSFMEELSAKAKPEAKKSQKAEKSEKTEKAEEAQPDVEAVKAA